ncbi:MAG: exo-alpha-sialidase [Pirellulales bacterium]|nr:exo-alpha-sialidase [Pirellulales bacterium]
MRIIRRIIRSLLLLSAVLRCASAIGEDAAAGSFPTTLLTASQDNPRNSEGDFILLNNGDLLFIYSHYYTQSGEDAAPADLASRRSTDGGRTWSSDSRQVVANEGKQNVMSVSLLRLSDGRIALFYLRKNSSLDLRPVVRYSADEAATWSEPAEIIPESELGYYVVNNDRALQLDSGRLILPAAHHVDNRDNSVGRYAEAVCYLSDDGGGHWRRGKEAARVSREVGNALQEPGVAPLGDGRLLMYCRTSEGSQYFAYSSDEGETWSQPQPGTLQSPLAPASIERIPGTTDLLAVWNNNSTRGYHRTPLTAAVSRDDGQTWTNVIDLERDPDGFYCYTAIEFVDDGVLFGYCAGRDGLPDGLLPTKLVRAPLAPFKKP